MRWPLGPVQAVLLIAALTALGGVVAVTSFHARVHSVIGPGVGSLSAWW